MKRSRKPDDDAIRDAPQREARCRRRPSADDVRGYARETLRPPPPLASDPVGTMIGNDDYEPADIDEVVYG